MVPEKPLIVARLAPSWSERSARIRSPEGLESLVSQKGLIIGFKKKYGLPMNKNIRIPKREARNIRYDFLKVGRDV